MYVLIFGIIMYYNSNYDLYYFLPRLTHVNRNVIDIESNLHPYTANEWLSG